uniref:Uncharacterized protein n=1 Tax=Nelumbo nucifera TaxID=4432 RepID=A0A822Z387_NELNU|nr:TPA_asm: hypothetical protein HUJ06_008566 [Nelumbo nucifera]
MLELQLPPPKQSSTSSSTSLTSHMPKSCVCQNTTRPRNIAQFRGPTELRELEDEAGKEWDGESPESGPNETISSGFGGLGLEGMVGRDDTVGEVFAPPGVGNNGSMSGDNAGEGAESGGFGKKAGAADMAEDSNFSSEARVSESGSMEATMSAKSSEKEAIK